MFFPQDQLSTKREGNEAKRASFLNFHGLFIIKNSNLFSSLRKRQRSRAIDLLCFLLDLFYNFPGSGLVVFVFLPNFLFCSRFS